jgi:tetratricopeptide (TPR) repeat protein
LRLRLQFALALSGLAASCAAQEPTALCDLLRSSRLEQSAREAFDQKLYEGAARDFQAAFDACPSHHAILLELSETQLRRREFQPAIQAAQRYVALEPDKPAGKLALANAYFMAQSFPDALSVCGEILKTDPGEPAALKLKGNIEYLTGHLDQALATFVALLENHPDDEDASYMLGRIYYQEGRIDHAIGQFQRVLKINPKSYKAYDNLGLCYQTQGNTTLAMRYFLTAIKLVDKDHPDYDWVYANVASMLLDNGDAEKAFAAASKAADRNPYSARNFYLGGKALSRLGKNELSINWLERSVALDPRYPEPLYLLGRVYAEMGQEDKANAALEKFRALKATTPRQRK